MKIPNWCPCGCLHSEFICSPLIQAAIGSVSLDMARQKGFTGQIEEEFGIQVNCINKFVIVIILLLLVSFALCFHETYFYYLITWREISYQRLSNNSVKPLVCKTMYWQHVGGWWLVHVKTSKVSCLGSNCGLNLGPWHSHFSFRTELFTS